MTTYATVYDLEDRLSSTYSVPDDAETLLAKASELIDYFTMGRATVAFAEGSDDEQAEAVTLATCDQVEFWLEVGEEHDVTGLRGSLVGGRLQVHPVAGTLAPRAKRTLSNAGLYWEGASLG